MWIYDNHITMHSTIKQFKGVRDYLHKYIVTPHTLLQQPKMKKQLQLYADQFECIRKEYCQLKGLKSD